MDRNKSHRTIRASLTLAAVIIGGAMLTPNALAGGKKLGSIWPQWRGPNRDAKLIGDLKWASDLSSLESSWRVELGPSYSGPIVAPDRVFVTETIDEQTEAVRALDRATGRELWQVRWPGAMKVPFFARSNGSWIRATPAYDGESLFVAGMRDVLVCLDASSGDERWRIDFTERFSTPLPAFGFVSSPLAEGPYLYAQAGASLVKINKSDGTVVWRTLEASGDMMDSAFSSPVMATVCGVRQLIVQTRQELAGVLPESGEILWRQVVPSFRGMNILTPTVYEDSIFTSTYKNATYLYEVERSDNAWSVKRAWTDKSQGYMSSPLLIGHHGYLHLGNGRLACFDLRDGRQAWRSKSLGKYWSMASQDEKILALNERGELLLVRANPSEFELLDRKTVSDQETWGHLAVAGDEIFVRELRGISAFRWERPTNP